MKKTATVCDACEAESSPSTRLDVWTEVLLHVSVGMSRLKKTFDLCPNCQDKVLNLLEEIHQTHDKGRFIR